jgi:hypothetical protein
LATILQAVNVWQLDNPEGSREECEEWLKKRWQEEWAHAQVPTGKKKK